MKTIIAGSRTINQYLDVIKAIKASGFEITEIVSGTAMGIDNLGEKYAYRHNIPVKQFPAQWNKFGKSAGYRRNVEMADYADALIAVWDGKSKGTQHMINIAKSKNLKVFIYLAEASGLP